MSKLADIQRVIEDGHCMGSDGLRDYHTARKVRDACRMKLAYPRFLAIKTLLNPYRVTVTLEQDCSIRIYRPSTNSEIILGEVKS